MSYSMTKFKVLSLNRFRVLSLNSFKNNLNIISFNKFKALSFFKLKSYLCVLLALFLSFSLTGCNWQGTSPAFSVSFYDENLNLLENRNVAEGIIYPSSIKTGAWFLANNTVSVTSHDLRNDINFYAVPNVHEITDQDGLNNIRDDLGGKYILLNDIDLNAAADGFDPANGWNPIGNFTSYIVNSPFTGIFNGNGNTISNLWINRTSTDYIGLFGYTENAQIKNLTVEVAEGKEVKGGDSVGIIVGFVVSSTVTNSYSTGNVSGYWYVGSIAGGVESSSITNSYSIGSVSGIWFVGGIAGDVRYSTITNSYSIGSVSGNRYVGGIAGRVRESTVTNSYSVGSVSGTYNYIGGIAGIVEYSSTITNNAAINPSVAGTGNVNRIVGVFDGSIVTNNFALDSMVGSFTDNGNPANHGISKTEINLKTQSTYSNAINGDGLGGLGWKFGNDADNPWKINAGKNNGYPYLYWE